MCRYFHAIVLKLLWVQLLAGRTNKKNIVHKTQFEELYGPGGIWTNKDMRILLELSSWLTLSLGLGKSSMMYTSASLTGEAPQISNKLQPVLNHHDT